MVAPRGYDPLMLPVLVCGCWLIGICMVDLAVEYSNDKMLILEFLKIELETPIALLGVPLLVTCLGLGLFYQMVFYSGYICGFTFVIMYSVWCYCAVYVKPAEDEMKKMDPADPMFNATHLDVQHWHIAQGDYVMMVGCAFAVFQSCFCFDGDIFFEDTELERWKRKQKRFKLEEEANERKKAKKLADAAAAEAAEAAAVAGES
jgi:hypothetical protein